MAAATHLLIANLELHDQLSDEEKKVLLGVIGPEREAAAGTNIMGRAIDCGRARFC